MHWTPTKIFTFTLVRSALLLSMIFSMFSFAASYTPSFFCYSSSLSSSKNQYLRCWYPAVTKNKLDAAKAKLFTGLPSLLEVRLRSLRQSHTNSPLSFASPREIKYNMLGENITDSIPYLCPRRCLNSVYSPDFWSISQIVISGWRNYPSPAARYMPSGE